MVEYENGKIYKIVNDVDDLIYVGSTVQSLEQVIDKHRHEYIFTKSKLHEHMLKLLNPNKFSIELLEAYPCNSRKELNNRLNFWIEKLIPQLNAKKVLTKEEKDKLKEDARQKKREYDKEHGKIYRALNADKIALRKKEYRQQVATLKKEVERLSQITIQ